MAENAMFSANLLFVTGKAMALHLLFTVEAVSI